MMSLHTSHVIAETDADFLPWSIGDLLRDATRQRPDLTALIVPAGAQGRAERRWTYRELLAEAERAAAALLVPFAPGDRVATWAGGSSDLLVLHLGAALAGIVLVTLNPACRGEELKYLLEQAEVRGIFLERVFRKMDNVAVLEALAAGAAPARIGVLPRRVAGLRRRRRRRAAAAADGGARSAGVDHLHLRHHGQAQGRRPRPCPRGEQRALHAWAHRHARRRGVAQRDADVPCRRQRDDDARLHGGPRHAGAAAGVQPRGHARRASALPASA